MEAVRVLIKGNVLDFSIIYCLSSVFWKIMWRLNMAFYQLMCNKTHCVSIKIGKLVLATEPWELQDAGNERCRRVGAGKGRGAVAVCFPGCGDAGGEHRFPSYSVGDCYCSRWAVRNAVLGQRCASCPPTLGPGALSVRLSKYDCEWVSASVPVSALGFRSELRWGAAKNTPCVVRSDGTHVRPCTPPARPGRAALSGTVPRGGEQKALRARSHSYGRARLPRREAGRSARACAVRQRGLAWGCVEASCAAGERGACGPPSAAASLPHSMAKSLRSKWRRKMRAEKRKKNAPKELERLKKILGTKADIIMEEVKEVATVLPPEKVLEQKGEPGSGWFFLCLSPPWVGKLVF